MVNSIKPSYYPPKEIKKYALKQINKPDIGPLAAVIVGFLGVSYLDLTDLSLLRVEDLIQENNKFRESFIHPASNKVVVIPNGWFREVLEGYLAWCKERNIGQQRLNIYSGRNPDSEFLLREDGSKFMLSPKSKEKSNSIMQPQALSRFVKRLQLPVGMTPRTINRSFLISIAEEQFKSGCKETALVNLELVTRLHRSTIARLTKRSPETVNESVRNLFG